MLKENTLLLKHKIQRNSQEFIREIFRITFSRITAEILEQLDLTLNEFLPETFFWTSFETNQIHRLFLLHKVW